MPPPRDGTRSTPTMAVGRATPLAPISAWTIYMLDEPADMDPDEREHVLAEYGLAIDALTHLS